MDSIKNILSALRNEMKNCGIDILVIPTSDPHFSEYTPTYWKTREFVSGFTGSAGTVLITETDALLWTDSRYFLQTDLELCNECYTLMKEHVKGYATIEEYISSFNQKTVGVTALLISVSAFENMADSIGNNKLVAIDDIIDRIWHNRPAIPASHSILLTESQAGESIESKINRLRSQLHFTRDMIYIVAPLDETAWLLNIRGGDIPYNPLTIAYTIIEYDNVKLFTDKNKFDVKDINTLKTKGVNIVAYNEFETCLLEIRNKIVRFNPSKLSYRAFNLVSTHNSMIPDSDENGIVATMKSVKNQIEIAGFRKSMIEDGVALVKFYIWLEQALKNNEVLTEYDLSEKLHFFRSLSSLFYSESFSSIVAFADNGAIVHYTPKKEESKRITSDNFLLIDSGAQYYTGTTDITRTTHLGTPTPEQKQDFTLVLMGNIDLASAIFPENTRGSQLDILARRYLCARSLNYSHGTGHGVGFFLNVHEGPQSIRMNENPVTLKPGMTLSNEPALYRTGKYGIRTENMLLCADYSQTEYGRFMKFETLTLCPIDTKSIDVSMLAKEHIAYINEYHGNVYKCLVPFLDEQETLWLKTHTQEICPN